MILYRPIKINLITQGFGENKNDIYKKWGMLGHNGVDFYCPTNTPFYWYSSGYGKVLKSEWDKNGGLGLFIITEENGRFFMHRFWHLKEVVVQSGQMLESGDLLGYTDNTGEATTGAHLHCLDIKEVIKDKYGNYVTINKDNGYKGSIDPSIFFRNTFIVDYVKQLKNQLSMLKKLVKLIKEAILKGRK